MMSPRGATGGVTYERCCGVVVLRGRDVLMLYRKKGSLDLPKGHMEAGETAEQTAIRELREESGITATHASFVHGFHESVASPKFGQPRVRKHVVWFIARVPEHADVDPQSILGPFMGHLWLPLRRAQHMATYQHTRELLRRARRFLSEQC